MNDEEPDVAVRASAWNRRHENLRVRAFAAHQRDVAAAGREAAAAVREDAARIRADAARVRDSGARTRDDAARVRDSAALVRDRAALARDLATKTREEAFRRRMLKVSTDDRAAWQEILDLDRRASDHSRDAAAHDRDAAELDRQAADKDRDAAERDRAAAARDREAADKDREAADADRAAAEADRVAADADRGESERDLGLVEDRLSQSERLAVMGRLAAGVAHEINNPLAALLATLASLRAATPSADREAETHLSLVTEAQLAAERIASVLAEMKAWLYGGGNAPARERLDLAELIDESRRIAGPAPERAANVQVELEPTEPLWGVRTRLSQVLTNLMINAANAVEGRPDKTIRVTARMAQNMVEIEVVDAGSGIAPEVLPHIFDPFFTTREGKGGTGLGLAIAQRVALEHGGALTVETKFGVGSTFRLRLPSGNETALSTAEPAASVSTQHRGKVLVIDDDGAFTRSLSRLLADRCDVTVAQNGSEGLELLLTPGASWHLVLCDLMMPVMNGLEMYRRLHEVRPDIAASIVFISGGATTSETHTFLADLPNVQLQKPFRIERLLALVDARANLAR